MYYKGYHITLEGKHVFDAIKLHINKYRITTNVNLLNKKKRTSFNSRHFKSHIQTLFIRQPL